VEDCRRLQERRNFGSCSRWGPPSRFGATSQMLLPPVVLTSLGSASNRVLSGGWGGQHASPQKFDACTTIDFSLENFEQSDRAGSSGRETANRHDAGLQGLRDCGDYDRRHRIDASHPQGTIRTGTSGCPRSTCACSVECRAPSLKSRQYNTGRFPAPAICTRAARGSLGIYSSTQWRDRSPWSLRGDRRSPLAPRGNRIFLQK
jgi:hypothetical protein